MTDVDDGFVVVSVGFHSSYEKAVPGSGWLKRIGRFKFRSMFLHGPSSPSIQPSGAATGILEPSSRSSRYSLALCQRSEPGGGSFLSWLSATSCTGNGCDCAPRGAFSYPSSFDHPCCSAALLGICGTLFPWFRGYSERERPFRKLILPFDPVGDDS